MKIFTNLPGTLRILFRAFRILTLWMAVFWLLTLTFNTWIQKRFTDQPKLIVTVGEIALPSETGSLGLSSNTAKAGSLGLHGLRGTLQMDLCSNDAALVSAVRWTIIPSMLVIIIGAWILFGSLHDLCANIERGEVFSEKNLRMVRGIGLLIIAYSLVGAALGFWGSYIMGGYFNQHVVLTGIQANLPFHAGMGAFHFNLPSGVFTPPTNLLTGCLVLVVAEAFRQGLNLKAENDLTV